ncbi:hypothetical protein L1049_008914 [Liquidambar formosana]|uniref:Uncharacterized protein n=1 Tax=Liquidambar formosana TaxID=63359 RepID=A0AAP0X8L1_LIQFO
MVVKSDKVNQGNKGDEDWKPQAYQAVVDELNVTLQLELTKDNVKNRSHYDARGYANKVIENWDDIVILCGKDRATEVRAENCEDVAEAIGEEEEDEVEFIPNSFVLEASVSKGVHTSRPQLPTHPLASTASTHQKKKARKDTLAEAIAGIGVFLSEFLASKKKKDRPKPTGEEIHEEVSKMRLLENATTSLWSLDHVGTSMNLSHLI